MIRNRDLPVQQRRHPNLLRAWPAPQRSPAVTPTDPSRDAPLWCGLDRDFHDLVIEAGFSPEGQQLRAKAEARFLYAEGKPFLLGPPQMVKGELAEWDIVFAA